MPDLHSLYWMPLLDHAASVSACASTANLAGVVLFQEDSASGSFPHHSSDFIVPRFRTWYDRHLLPRLLDFACSLGPIARQRRKIVPQAGGRVLEVGIGTGLNFAFYERDSLQNLVGVDPAGQMHALAHRRSRKAGIPVELLQISAETLPIASASIDCVVCTYTLCSIPDPLAALREIRRVLRPGGRFLFAEHGLAPDDAVAKWQARIEPYWTPIAGGCHLTRDVPALLREAGFRVQSEAAYIAWPKSLSYNFWGEATAD